MVKTDGGMTEAERAPQGMAKWELGPERIELRDRLSAYDERLADWYEAAIFQWQERHASAWAALAAHALRELMNNAAEWISGITLGTPSAHILRSLGNKYLQCKTESRCWNSSRWQGEIDEPLEQFLTEVDASVGGTPKRRQQAQSMFEQLDETLVEGYADRWHRLLDRFTGICHGGKRCTADEFEDNLIQLEEVLRVSLKAPSVDVRELDGIIAEGPTE